MVNTLQNLLKLNNRTLLTRGMGSKTNKKKGFTLVEILIVLALIAALSIPLIISYQNSRTTQALRTSAEELANQIRSAHVFAREANEQKGWGVVRTSDRTYSLVSGRRDSWTTVTTRKTENGVLIENDFFVWFDIASGETDSNYSIVLTTPNGITQTVSVVKTGLVEILN